MSCAVALIYIFIIPTFEHAFFFYNLLIHFKIPFSEKFHRHFQIKIQVFTFRMGTIIGTIYILEQVI